MRHGCRHADGIATEERDEELINLKRKRKIKQ